MNPFAIPMMFGPNALYYQLAMFKQMQNANEPIQMRIEPVIENNEIKNAKQYPEFKETQQPAVQIDRKKYIKTEKNRPFKQAAVHQIIDLEQDGADAKNTQMTDQDLFVSELTKKCSIFFNWISKTNTPLLAEQLWKNEKMLQAAQIYPQLNNNELQRLVDRDWRYMSEQNRKKIEQSYSYPPNQEQLERQLNEYAQNNNEL